MLLYTGNTAEFTPLKDVYSKFGNSYIERVATVFVMTMVLIQVKHGLMRIGLHKGYSIAGNEGKATERCPLDNLMQWIITQSKSFTRKAIRNISRFL